MGICPNLSMLKNLALSNPKVWDIIINREVNHRLFGSGQITRIINNDSIEIHHRVFFKIYNFVDFVRYYGDIRLSNDDKIKLINEPNKITNINYNIDNLASSELTNLTITKKLTEILLRINQIQSINQSLPEVDINWLKRNSFFLPLVIYYEKINKPILIATFCRKAGDYERVLDLTCNKSIIAYSERAKATMLTIRGGTYRTLSNMSDDNDYLNKAELCAKEAIRLNETFYPYNLLSAIAWDRGDADLSEAYREKARELGSKDEPEYEHINDEIRSFRKKKNQLVREIIEKKFPELFKLYK